MINTLAIINEPFAEMSLGKNTTLAYILSCSELGHEIYIHNLPIDGEVFPRKLDKSIKVFHLKKSEAEILSKKFREENLKIRNLVNLKKYEELAILKTPTVTEFLKMDFGIQTKLELKKVNFILQRLEPMKKPFPPEGLLDIASTLVKIKNIFPKHIFNYPITNNLIELQDKETPQEINKIYQQEIATPTAEFYLGSSETKAAIDFAIKKYHEIFGSENKAKIVIKPKNSAQSLGVFALQFYEFGFDLEAIKSKKISELSNVQIYKIQPKNLEEIIKILCFVERVKDDKNYASKLIGDISENEIFTKAQELYNQEILAQPFLEGISAGDIRANILKDKKENFYCAGYTFRSSNHEKIEDDFTTCYTAGKAVSKPISFLSSAEKKSLTAQCKIVVKILNNELREKYQNVIELGADFILVGDKISVMLGEINHHCPALIPISEAMSEFNYNEGLGFVKNAIQDSLSRQKIKSLKN